MKKTISKYLIGLIVLLTCVITLAHADIKVGIVGPLSGGSLTVGEQQEIGAKRAIADINENGGLLGHKLITVSLDDACDKQQAIAAAKLLVQEGVVFVVGHVCSDSTLAVSKIYEDAGIIAISPASTNPLITESGHKNIFRVIGRDDQQGFIAGNFLADNFSKKRIGIIHDKSVYGQGLATITRNQLNKRGVTEVIFESYKRELSDYSLLVKKLLASKIDVLYAGGYVSDIGIILRQTKTAIPNIQLLGGDSLAGQEFIVLAGEAAIGSLFTFGPDIRRRPEAEKIVASIISEDAFQPDGYTLYGYAAVQAWTQAVEKAGSIETKAVINSLRTNRLDTVLGQIGFDEKGDVKGAITFTWYKFGKSNYTLVE